MFPVSALLLFSPGPWRLGEEEKGARPRGREGMARWFMPGISKKAWRSASRGGCALLSLSSPTAGGYGFVHAHRYSKPGLVRGRGLPGGGRGVEGSGAGGRRWRESGSRRVPAPPTDYFLGCGLFPRSPSISITVCGVSWLSTWRGRQGWRGQYMLAHLRRAWGSGGGGQGSSAAEPGGGEKSLALSPRNLSPLRSERTL